MYGLVDRIWHNQQEDGSEFWVVSIDGERYSTWDRNLLANVQEGDWVEFAFTPSGRYRNLTALRRIKSSAFSAAFGLPATVESLRLVRVNCLRAAAEILKDSSLLPEPKTELALTIARKLEDYVLQPLEARASGNTGEEANANPEESEDSEGEK